MSDSFSFHLKSLEDTHQLGKLIGENCRGGEVIFLHGELGAGKTTLTQMLSECLGITTIVNSPTFMIIKEYEVPKKDLTLIHADLYRVSDADDLYSTGLGDLVGKPNVVSVIEWPERVVELSTVPHIDIYLTLDGDVRNVRCEIMQPDKIHNQLYRRLFDAYPAH